MLGESLSRAICVASPMKQEITCSSPAPTPSLLDWPCGFSVWVVSGSDWTITVETLISNHTIVVDTYLLKLAFQVTIHTIWRERNDLKHNQKYHDTAHMVRYLDKLIRNWFSFLRPRKPSFYSEALQRWFARNA